MKKLLSILLAIAMLITPMTGLQESYAISFDFVIAYETKSVPASSDVEISLKVTDCSCNITALTFANLINSWKGFTIKGVKAGNLISSSNLSYESDFDSVTLSNINVNSTGTLLVFTVKTPATPGSYEITPSIGYCVCPGAQYYGTYYENSATITVEKNNSQVTTHSVTFNANSGAGGPGALSGNEGSTVTIPSTVPTKTNYIFLGWAESAQSGNAKYKAGDKITLDRDYLLYAVWKADDTAYLTYNANGKTLTSGLPDTVAFQKGTAINLSSVKPSAAGFTFSGWSTNASDTTAKYKPGSSVTFSTDTTLYAIWKRITYTISYDANGGNNAPDNQTKKYNEDITISTVKPTRDGYNFVGWSTSKSSTTAQYYAGDKYSKNEALSLYAVWADKTYAVTYKANGGSEAPAEQTKVHGQDLTISSQIPKREGYTFEGWATSKDSTEVTYKPGAKYSKNAKLTLYAVWKLEVYTISFDANGGKNAPDSVQKVRNSIITIPTTKPSREGYTFKGWAVTKDGKVAYKAGDEYGTEGDATLYAVWKIKTFTVKYDANGGNPAPAEQTKTYFEALTLTKDVPTRSGYKFIGWATDSAATKAEYASGAKYTTEASITLYAVWQRTTYTIKFDANGGTNAPASIKKTRGVDLTLYFADSEIPKRDGYFCIGWATKKTATSPTYYLVSDVKITANADMTLYAVWIKNPFTDVNPTKWQSRYVAYMYYRGAMNGTSKTTFELSRTFSRGQCAGVLYNLADKPDVDKNAKAPFTDISKSIFYNQIIWASEAGVVTGAYGKFNPKNDVTRQDFILMLYRYAEKVAGIDVEVSNANAYKEKADYKEVSSWTVKAVNWGYVNGFIGNGSNLMPKASITRAQAATIIARFMVKYGI